MTWPSSGRRFLSAPPEVAVLPTADGPKVRADERGTSVPTVGGRPLRLESGHRSNLSVLVMDARPLHPCRPSRGVRHRARGYAGTLQVGGFSGCGHLQLCHLTIACETGFKLADGGVSKAGRGGSGRRCAGPRRCLAGLLGVRAGLSVFSCPPVGVRTKVSGRSATVRVVICPVAPATTSSGRCRG